MPTMNTYSLARPYPGGLSITDAITISGNRRRPVRLERAGDTIDLTAVDVETFSRSAYGGTIRHLFLTGVLASGPQEIPVARHSELTTAFLTLQENGGNRSGLAGAPTVIQLEGGLAVGVMNMPDPENRLPDLPIDPALVIVSRQLEPGIVAPGAPAGSEGGAKALAQQLAEQPKSAKKRRGRKDPAADEQEEAAPQDQGFSRWKDNIDFQTQKTRVMESTNQEFLAWVAQNDESRQLQKIAAARLAEIQKP